MVDQLGGEAGSKALATLHARAALAGWALYPITQTTVRTSYVLSGSRASYPLSDLNEVAAFLRCSAIQGWRQT